MGLFRGGPGPSALRGRAALITGGDGGIGATAGSLRWFVRESYRIGLRSTRRLRSSRMRRRLILSA
jgi:hypothetical protein